MAWRRKRSFRGRRRARRSSSIWSRKKFGDPIGSSTTKNFETVSNQEDEESRSLYVHSLAILPRNTTGNDVNLRERNRVNIRGFKIYLQFLNKEANRSFSLNVAVVSPKYDTLAQSSFPPIAFFRDATTNSLERDFTTANSNLIFSKFGINSDLYNVFKHKRYILGNTVGDVTGPNQQTGRSFKTIKWYVPIKRQLRFDGDTGIDRIDDCYLVYWFDEIGALQASPSIVDSVRVTKICHLVYREPRV